MTLLRTALGLSLLLGGACELAGQSASDTIAYMAR